jgi:hypothetical protein
MTNNIDFHVDKHSKQLNSQLVNPNDHFSDHFDNDSNGCSLCLLLGRLKGMAGD